MKKVSLNLTIITLTIFTILVFSMQAEAQHSSKTVDANQIFNYGNKILLADKFQKNLDQWKLSIDANYKENSIPTLTSRVQIVHAPNLPDENAVRFIMPGTPGKFRSELASAHEKELQERWYGERIYVESVPTNLGGYIVMQWHALMGKNRVDKDFPNLAIWVKDSHWEFTTAYGSPAKIQRSKIKTDDILVARKWNNVVMHAKWSEGKDGLIQIWINNVLVMNRTGQNLYDGLTSTSPYFKTGIYRPKRKHTTDTEPQTIVFVTDVKIGNKWVSYNDVAPR